MLHLIILLLVKLILVLGCTFQELFSHLIFEGLQNF